MLIKTSENYSLYYIT